MTGNLAFPLLLVGGLFLLSRRGGGAGGGGGMGGGNNPMNFAKSKAKFQMEPNTGITFDDVAGVNEAKEDFMEVGPHSSQSMHANTTHNLYRSRSMPGTTGSTTSVQYYHKNPT